LKIPVLFNSTTHFGLSRIGHWKDGTLVGVGDGLPVRRPKIGMLAPGLQPATSPDGVYSVGSRRRPPRQTGGVASPLLSALSLHCTTDITGGF
jgi:hypothetical protein